MPPSIPTSFIPHPGGAPQQKYRFDFAGALAFLAYAVLFIVVAAAISVFLYERVLAAQLSAKDAQLTAAEANIDPATITGFVRLRDRLTASKTLLDGHVALSSLFSTLENVLVSGIQMNAVGVVVGSDGSTVLTAKGAAKSFNTLAAVSDAFSQNGNFKNAIFSNISLGQGGLVTFALSATIDPTLIAFHPQPAVGVPASTTPTTP